MEFVNWRSIDTDLRIRMRGLDPGLVEEAEATEIKSTPMFVLRRDWGHLLEEVEGHQPPKAFKLLRPKARI